MGKQKQAHPQTVVEVGSSHLGLRFGGLSCLQGHMGVGWPTFEAIPALPMMLFHLAPKDPLAQLLCVLQDLREAHSSSLAGASPKEPHHLLELQT